MTSRSTETIALVADGGAGLLAVDFGDAAAPKIVGSWDSPGEATGLALAGKTVFLADGSAGLSILDVSVPARPKPVGALDTDGTAEGVALAAGYCLRRRRPRRHQGREGRVA
ncbi:MAG: hypothetical protein MZU91_11100 [Desulfosudis oleivorans]|nr:hypothetical protein [Desulfosudis oleivorans]